MLLSLQRGLSLLLAAWVSFAYAQESDVKSIPLRTHSLAQVGLLECYEHAMPESGSLIHPRSPTLTPTFNRDGSISAAAQ